MTTYRYFKFEPGDNENWNIDHLMNIISEMIMRSDLQINEALQRLIDRGLPVNLFLKNSGMEELLSGLKDEIHKRIENILKKYDLKEALTEVSNSLKLSYKKVKINLENKPDEDSSKNIFLEQLAEALKNQSPDILFRLKRELMHRKDYLETVSALHSMILLFEDHARLQEGILKYKFYGKIGATKEKALALLEELDQLSKITRDLDDFVKNGDLFSFNLDTLARYLGPESYQEFVEKRNEIIKKLSMVLQEQGQIIEDFTDGEQRLSARAVKRIGRRAIESIFSELKTGLGGDTHQVKISGESENILGTTRSIEFGDSISDLDISSSVSNAAFRRENRILKMDDLEIFVGRGKARSSTVVLIDMSGSMARADRFYNAKKVTLALDGYIREEFSGDRLEIIGFGTTASSYSPAELITLQPYQVTMFNQQIKLRLKMSDLDDENRSLIPLYFTNLQRGLELSRKLLGAENSVNKQIILITDGVPTAHFEQDVLHINYPPKKADFNYALREVKLCNADNIIINTFLLTSEWEFDYFEEEPFIKKFARIAQGRIFYPHPEELDKMVLLDFVSNKKQLFNY